MAVKVTSENFDQEVLKSKEKVLLDFWATWCGPCRMLLPIVDEISKEVKSAKICKINVDEQPELAERYQIMAIPTMLIVNEGKIEKRMIGLQEKSAILSALGEC